MLCHRQNRISRGQGEVELCGMFNMCEALALISQTYKAFLQALLSS